MEGLVGPEDACGACWLLGTYELVDGCETKLLEEVDIMYKGAFEARHSLVRLFFRLITTTCAYVEENEVST